MENNMTKKCIICFKVKSEWTWKRLGILIEISDRPIKDKVWMLSAMWHLQQCSHDKRISSIPGQFTWDISWTKWQWQWHWVFPKHFSSSLLNAIPPMPHNICHHHHMGRYRMPIWALQCQETPFHPIPTITATSITHLKDLFSQRKQSSCKD
jgi:hypothetical protein